MTSQSSAPAETPEEKADRLLQKAMYLDRLATDAMEAAEAAFRKISKPMPLLEWRDGATNESR